MTAGKCAEIGQAIALITGFSADYVTADKGYDAIVVIPPRKNRLTAREYDVHLYRERNLGERLFQRLKHYRRYSL